MQYRDDFFAKTPFYMTYPMQNLYLTEMEYEKDMERMKELYPREVKRLQEMIEQRCDEMEYEGSRMYDENPDRYMLEEEAMRLYERFLRENPQSETADGMDAELAGLQYCHRGNPWLYSLIGILFHDEIYRRRCRHRRCRRWW